MATREKGSTGRGINPAYADILLRHPLRAADLINFNKEKIIKHYLLYESLVNGLGEKLSETLVPRLGKEEKIPVGTKEEFVSGLYQQSQELTPFIADVFDFLLKKWSDEKTAFIFEKAQAVGLDSRFGTRKLPTVMEESLANKIREDANEYGATTKRPRGIAYLDLPALKFFSRVGLGNFLVLTHMDIVYPGVPIKICVDYEINGKSVLYRPDQEFLNKVAPKYIEFAPWDKDEIRKAKNFKELPKKARNYFSVEFDRIGNYATGRY